MKRLLGHLLPTNTSISLFTDPFRRAHAELPLVARHFSARMLIAQISPNFGPQGQPLFLLHITLFEAPDPATVAGSSSCCQDALCVRQHRHAGTVSILSCSSPAPPFARCRSTFAYAFESLRPSRSRGPAQIIGYSGEACPQVSTRRSPPSPRVQPGR